VRFRRRPWRRKFADAFRGLARAVRTQSSFAVHLAAAGLVVGLAAAFRVSAVEWCLLAGAIAAVLAAEMFNSALEALARAFGPGRNPRIRDALDMAGAAVLVAAGGAAVLGAIVFGRRVAAWLVGAAVCVGAVHAGAADIVLWPDGVPEPRVPAEPAETVEVRNDGISRRSNVSNPRLVVFDVPRDDPDGLRSALVVVPGGGFGILADEHEGGDVCRWFNERGFVCFTLLYRVPTGTFEVPNAAPVMDAQRAVAEVRSRAGEFGIDPAKIALVGFSAGGQTALVAAANPPLFPGAPDAAACRPDALALIYPWKVAQGDAVRGDVPLGAGMPPTFILQAADDKTSPAADAAVLYRGLLAAQVPAEIHVYESGGHGFGMKPRPGGGVLGAWPERVLDWLRTRGF